METIFEVQHPASPQAAADSEMQPLFQYWSSQVDADTSDPAPWAGARMLDAWAQAILMYWNRLLHGASLDLTQPLFVLDLAPGDLRLASALFGRLIRGMQGHGLPPAALAYLACARSPELAERMDADLRGLGQRPHGADFNAIRVARWNGRVGAPVLVGASREPLFSMRNPVVALAVGAWSHLPERQLAIRYGKWYEAWVDPMDLAAGHDSPCEWRGMDDAAAGSTAEALLMTHYGASVPAAALRLALPAIEQCDAVDVLSGGRYLLLAADRGVSCAEQIRAGSMSLPTPLSAGPWRLPVNFDALARHQRSNGARVAIDQRSDDGAVMYVACRDDALGVDDAVWTPLLQPLADAHPDDRGRDCRYRPSCTEGPIDAADLVHQLRRSGSDPAALHDVLAAVHLQSLVGDPRSLRALHQALVRCWDATSLAERAQLPGLALAELLADLGAWGAARAVAMQLSACDASQLSQLLRLRARIAMSTGYAGDALRLAQQAKQAQREGDVGRAASALAEFCRERLAGWLVHPWYLPEWMRDDDMCLELRDEAHAEAIAVQLRDSQIAVMAGLPEAGPAGPDELTAEDAVEYAVMHRHHGLIGVVGIRPIEDIAGIHVWIGADYQGAGLGRRSLALLIRVARAAGVRRLYGLVFRDNQRCLRLLDRLGFVALRGHAMTEMDDVVAMHLCLDERGASLVPKDESLQYVRCLYPKPVDSSRALLS